MGTIADKAEAMARDYARRKGMSDERALAMCDMVEAIGSVASLRIVQRNYKAEAFLDAIGLLNEGIGLIVINSDN